MRATTRGFHSPLREKGRGEAKEMGAKKSKKAQMREVDSRRSGDPSVFLKDRQNLLMSFL